MANDEKEPLGKRLRDFITPALEDDRAKKVQAEIVNDLFEKIAGQMPNMFEQEFTDFFNEVSARTQSRPQTKNPMIVHALTAGGGRDGDSSFNPIKRLQLPVSTAFTSFTVDEIREMPGWIKLHETARDMDISVKLMALTADESRGSMLPPILILDASKTYESGAIESPLYPNLPEKKSSFDKRGGQGFDL